MKSKIYYLLLLLSTLSSRSFSQDVLTNKSIITLTKAGLPSTVIINKMKIDKCSFDLSTDALIELKNNKVADDVLNAMFDKKPTDANSSNMAVDTASSKFNGPGIYYFNAATNTYTEVTSTLSSGNRSVTGITGVKFVSDLDNDRSPLRLTSTPIFYFYYGTVNSDKEGNNGFIRLMHAYMPSKEATDLNPNDFKLIKLTKRKGKRSFQTAEMSGFKGLTNGLTKDVLSFTFNKVGPNLYRVNVDAPLQPGEYCFVCTSGIPVQGSLNANRNDCNVFDFGVN